MTPEDNYAVNSNRCAAMDAVGEWVELNWLGNLDNKPTPQPVRYSRLLDAESLRVIRAAEEVAGELNACRIKYHANLKQLADKERAFMTAPQWIEFGIMDGQPYSKSIPLTDVMKGGAAPCQPGQTGADATQVDGDHYKSMGDHQPWTVLQTWLTPEEYRGYQKGTAIAYLAREGQKGGDKDIAKAKHHLEKLLETLA